MESEFLRRIVRQAEEITKKPFEVHGKGDYGDLVTNLDFEVEQFLIEQIKAEYPDFDIVSEETNSDGQVTDNCFIFDPIDGTINFANGLPIWGIQIACRKGGQTVASVIDLPKLGEFYYADETGAFCNGEKIMVKEAPVKAALYSVIGHNCLPGTAEMRKYSRNHRNLGSACVAFAFMARGSFQGVNFRVNQPWDYAPGLFLCKMAGAAVVDEPGFHAAAMNQEYLDLLRQTNIESDD